MLSKKEIQYIDNYLIKNKVRYWDVRLELLDHIVSAVEDKLELEGVSFNEALLQVHKGFGNQFIEFGVPKKEIFTKGLYQSNIGFKKFERKKQKEIGRKYRKLNWRFVKKQLVNPVFLLEYGALIGLFFMIYKFYPKYVFLIGLLVLMVPTVYSSYFSLKDRTLWKSLSYSMAANSAMLGWSLYNLGFYIMKDYYGSIEQMPIYIFVVVTCLFYPSIRASIKVHNKVYNENRDNYKLKLQN